MNFLIVTLGVILFDRAIPAGGLRFTTSALRPDVEAGWRDYGWLRFRRSMFATAVCICGGLIDCFPNARDKVGIAAILFATGFAIAACVDAWRAFVRT